jgi:hypothetical protein
MFSKKIVLAFTLILFGSSATAQGDFEGIWTANHPPRMGQPDPSAVKMTPAGLAEFEAFTPEKDTQLRCLMPGIPLGLIDPYPIEIVYQEHQILILYEHFHQVRRVFIDGRTAPDHWQPSLGGYSTGEWDGDTLVITTTHLSPDNNTWTAGYPFSGDESAYVVERWSRDGDELNLTGEVHDATNYEKPYVVNGHWTFAPDGEIWEYECIPEYAGVK